MDTVDQTENPAQQNSSSWDQNADGSASQVNVEMNFHWQSDDGGSQQPYDGQQQFDGQQQHDDSSHQHFDVTQQQKQQYYLSSQPRGTGPPPRNQEYQPPQPPHYPPQQQQYYPGQHPAQAKYPPPPNFPPAAPGNPQSHPPSVPGPPGYRPNPAGVASPFHPNSFGAPGSNFAPSPPNPANINFIPPVRPPPFGVGGPSHLVRPDIGLPVAWTTELFGCLDDCYGFPLVVLAPCIAFGQMAEIIDTGYNSCHTAGIIYALAFFLGIPCLYSYTYRTKMRYKFNLRQDPLDDFCTHLWCEFCAIAQEYRELRYRGIDPNLGYLAQEQIVVRAMAAPVAPRMRK